MSVHAIREQQQTRLIFEGAMTIYEAQSARRSLLEALAGSQPVEVDLTGVSEIDLAGMQLLLTLLAEPKVSFLANTSEAVTSALHLLDMQRLFKSVAPA